MLVEAPERPRAGERPLLLRPARSTLRLAAYVVDWLVMVIVSSLLVALGGLQLYLVTQRGQDQPPDAAVWAFLGISFLALPVWLLGTLVGWSRGGVSIGKMALGLRIVDRHGRPPGVVRAAIRLLVFTAENLALLLAPAAFGVRQGIGGAVPGWALAAALLLCAAAVLALLPAAITPLGRTLHDRAAGTVVAEA